MDPHPLPLLHCQTSPRTRTIATAAWLAVATGLMPVTVNKSLAHRERVGVVAELTFQLWRPRRNPQPGRGLARWKERARNRGSSDEPVV